MTKAQEFVSKVGELAKHYNLPVFVVTEGASLYSNNNCEAVKHAREAHIVWEKAHGINSNHDFLKDDSIS